MSSSGWIIVQTKEAAEEIRRLPADMQARYLRIAELIIANGPLRVSEPHIKKISGKIWEMHMRGRDGISRALHFHASGRRVVVVRAFIKKTQKTPRNEIAIAEARMKEFLDEEIC